MTGEVKGFLEYADNACEEATPAEAMGFLGFVTEKDMGQYYSKALPRADGETSPIFNVSNETEKAPKPKKVKLKKKKERVSSPPTSPEVHFRSKKGIKIQPPNKENPPANSKLSSAPPSYVYMNTPSPIPSTSLVTLFIPSVAFDVSTHILGLYANVC